MVTKPTVLITGARGRIGRGLSVHLQERLVLRLSDRASQKPSDITGGNSYRECDLADAEGLPQFPLDLYRVSKCFVEAAGRLTAVQRDISVIVLRIGAFRSPLLTYASSGEWKLDEYVDPEDLFELIERAITAESPHFAILHAVGDNQPSRFDISDTRRLLGWQPRQASHQLTPEQVDAMSGGTRIGTLLFR